MVVTRKMNGMKVEALPRFHGGCEPDYWVAVVDSHIIFRTFKSPTDVFDFVEQQYLRGNQAHMMV